MSQVTTPKPPKAPKPQKSALVTGAIFLAILSLVTIFLAALFSLPYVATLALIWAALSVTAAVLSLRE